MEIDVEHPKYEGVPPSPMKLKGGFEISKATALNVNASQLGVFACLPFEAFLYVCSFLDGSGLENLSLLNKQFHKISNQFWEDLMKTNFKNFLATPAAVYTHEYDSYKAMCMRIKHHQRAMSKENYLCGWEKTWDDFLNCLPSDDCRYGIFAIEPESTSKPAIVFVLWGPENSRIRSKMIYASCKSELRRHLEGISYEVSATTKDELDYQTMLNYTKLKSVQ